MDPQTVLLELLDENNWYINNLLEECSEECLHWQPHPAANSIAVTIWHTSRIFDIFIHQYIRNLSSDAELWLSNGWARQTDYDPRGTGTLGWGAVTGYSSAEMQQIPKLDKNILAQYYAAVTKLLKDYIQETDIEKLLEKAPGYGEKQTNYFWVRHPIFDLTRHVGECLALRSLWEHTYSK